MEKSKVKGDNVDGDSSDNLGVQDRTIYCRQFLGYLGSIGAIQQSNML